MASIVAILASVSTFECHLKCSAHAKEMMNRIERKKAKDRPKFLAWFSIFYDNSTQTENGSEKETASDLESFFSVSEWFTHPHIAF